MVGRARIVVVGGEDGERDELRRWLTAAGAESVAHLDALGDGADDRCDPPLSLAATAAGLNHWRWDVETGELSWQGGRPFLELAGTHERAKTAPLDDALRRLHPDDRIHVRASLEAALEEGRPLDIEFRALRTNDTARWLAAKGDVIRDEGGRSVSIVGVSFDITEKKQVEEDQAYLAALVGSSDEAVAGMALDGKINAWNGAAEALFGYRADEILGRPVKLLVPDDRRDEAERLIARLLDGETNVRLETVRLHKDGTPRRVALTLSRVVDPAGRLLGVSANVRDVGRQRAAETALRRSEARLRAAFEQAPFAFQTYAPDGALKTANDAWYKLWKAPPDALDGYNVFEDPHVEALGVREEVARAFAGEVVALPALRYDPARIGRSGRPRWVKVSFYPLIDERGEVFEVVEVTDDVTAAKEAEEEMRRVDELRRLALDSSKLGMWDWDLRTDNIHWDERTRALFGIPHDDARVSDALARIHPDDQPAVREAIERATDPDVENDGAVDVTYRTCPGAESVYWVHASGQVLFRESGALRDPVRFVGVVRDITQEKDAERRKDDYLAMLGHELRNPLAAMRTAAELIALQGESSPSVERAASVLVRQSSHMARLLDGLLDISRITRGKVAVDKHETDLVALLAEVVNDRLKLAEERGVDLRARLPERGSLRLWADAARLNQVFDNLVGNAIKFTDRGGKITVEAQERGDQTQVTVRDTGVGFSPAIKDQLFQAFQQGPQDLSRQHGGLGLGLALARGLVELHDGRIDAHSGGPGRGACFEVWLPLMREPHATVDAEPSSSTAGERDHLRLLVIEDNEDAAAMLQSLLEIAGHEVAVAHRGDEGLALAPWADAVLCDIGLPGGMSGFEVAERLRTQPETEHTPLIALTGYGRPEDKERCEQAGFDAHLTKPVDMAHLAQVLEEVQASA